MIQPAGLLCPCGFCRQEYWSALAMPSSRVLPCPGVKSTSLVSPALAGRFFTLRAIWEALYHCSLIQSRVLKLFPVVFPFQKTPRSFSYFNSWMQLQSWERVIVRYSFFWFILHCLSMLAYSFTLYRHQGYIWGLLRCGLETHSFEAEKSQGYLLIPFWSWHQGASAPASKTPPTMLPTTWSFPLVSDGHELGSPF